MASAVRNVEPSKANFFTDFQQPFPEIVFGKVDTVQFLEAAKCVVTLVDSFGAIFAAVKYDMLHNIEKVRSVYVTDRDSFRFLNDIVAKERLLKQGELATEALLWLKRGLRFQWRFLTGVLRDAKKGVMSEDLVSHLKEAYEETLKPYHGWFSRHIFEMICGRCPSKSALINILILKEKKNDEYYMWNCMESFLDELGTNLDALECLYLT